MAVRSRSATPGRLDPNLASAPFLNARPVERLALFLWVLALVVGGAAYWSTASSRQEAGARRAEAQHGEALALAGRGADEGEGLVLHGGLVGELKLRPRRRSRRRRLVGARLRGAGGRPRRGYRARKCWR